MASLYRRELWSRMDEQNRMPQRAPRRPNYEWTHDAANWAYDSYYDGMSVGNQPQLYNAFPSPLISDVASSMIADPSIIHNSLPYSDLDNYNMWDESHYLSENNSSWQTEETRFLMDEIIEGPSTDLSFRQNRWNQNPTTIRDHSPIPKLTDIFPKPKDWRETEARVQTGRKQKRSWDNKSKPLSNNYKHEIKQQHGSKKTPLLPDPYFSSRFQGFPGNRTNHIKKSRWDVRPSKDQDGSNGARPKKKDSYSNGRKGCKYAPTTGRPSTALFSSRDPKATPPHKGQSGKTTLPTNIRNPEKTGKLKNTCSVISSPKKIDRNVSKCSSPLVEESGMAVISAKTDKKYGENANNTNSTDQCTPNNVNEQGQPVADTFHQENVSVPIQIMEPANNKTNGVIKKKNSELSMMNRPPKNNRELNQKRKASIDQNPSPLPKTLPASAQPKNPSLNQVEPLKSFLPASAHHETPSLNHAEPLKSVLPASAHHETPSLNHAEPLKSVLPASAHHETPSLNHAEPLKSVLPASAHHETPSLNHAEPLKSVLPASAHHETPSLNHAEPLKSVLPASAHHENPNLIQTQPHKLALSVSADSEKPSLETEPLKAVLPASAHLEKTNLNQTQPPKLAPSGSTHPVESSLNQTQPLKAVLPAPAQTPSLNQAEPPTVVLPASAHPENPSLNETEPLKAVIASTHPENPSLNQVEPLESVLPASANLKKTTLKQTQPPQPALSASAAHPEKAKFKSNFIIPKMSNSTCKKSGPLASENNESMEQRIKLGPNSLDQNAKQLGVRKPNIKFQSITNAQTKPVGPNQPRTTPQTKINPPKPDITILKTESYNIIYDPNQPRTTSQTKNMPLQTVNSPKPDNKILKKTESDTIKKVMTEAVPKLTKEVVESIATEAKSSAAKECSQTDLKSNANIMISTALSAPLRPEKQLVASRIADQSGRSEQTKSNTNLLHKAASNSLRAERQSLDPFTFAAPDIRPGQARCLSDSFIQVTGSIQPVASQPSVSNEQPPSASPGRAGPASSGHLRTKQVPSRTVAPISDERSRQTSSSISSAINPTISIPPKQSASNEPLTSDFTNVDKSDWSGRVTSACLRTERLPDLAVKTPTVATSDETTIDASSSTGLPFNATILIPPAASTVPLSNEKPTTATEITGASSGQANLSHRAKNTKPAALLQAEQKPVGTSSARRQLSSNASSTPKNVIVTKVQQPKAVARPLANQPIDKSGIDMAKLIQLKKAVVLDNAAFIADHTHKTAIVPQNLTLVVDDLVARNKHALLPLNEQPDRAPDAGMSTLPVLQPTLTSTSNSTAALRGESSFVPRISGSPPLLTMNKRTGNNRPEVHVVSNGVIDTVTVCSDDSDDGDEIIITYEYLKTHASNCNPSASDGAAQGSHIALTRNIIVSSGNVSESVVCPEPPQVLNGTKFPGSDRDTDTRIFTAGSSQSQDISSRSGDFSAMPFHDKILPENGIQIDPISAALPLMTVAHPTAQLRTPSHDKDIKFLRLMIQQSWLKLCKMLPPTQKSACTMEENKNPIGNPGLAAPSKPSLSKNNLQQHVVFKDNSETVLKAEEAPAALAADEAALDHSQELSSATTINPKNETPAAPVVAAAAATREAVESAMEVGQTSTDKPTTSSNGHEIGNGPTKEWTTTMSCENANARRSFVTTTTIDGTRITMKIHSLSSLASKKRKNASNLIRVLKKKLLHFEARVRGLKKKLKLNRLKWLSRLQVETLVMENMTRIKQRSLRAWLRALGSRSGRLDSTTLEDVVENELLCVICCEPFFKATALGCCHIFCKYCLNKWKKTREKERVTCPVCRTIITCEHEVPVLDNYINKIIEKLSDDCKQRRAQQAIIHRKAETIRARRKSKRRT